jgi:hypothetical protein
MADHKSCAADVTESKRWLEYILDRKTYHRTHECRLCEVNDLGIIESRRDIHCVS